MKTLLQIMTEKLESKQVVYLMVGIPGSGKSTWCKNTHPDLPVVSRDNIRAELGYTKDSNEKAVLTRDQENQVTNAEYKKIFDLATDGKDFIIDDTNTGIYRKNMIDKLRKLNLKIIGVNLKTPLSTCIERRKGQIPEYIMHKLYAKKIDLKPGEVDEIINVEGE